MQTILFIIPIVFFAITLAALCKSSALRFLIILLFTAFIIFECISIYFSDGPADYQFYYNLNFIDIFSGLSIFFWYSVVSVVVFIIILLVLCLLSYWIYHNVLLKYRLIAVTCSFVLLVLMGHPLIKLYEIYQIVSAPRQSFDQALDKLGMDSKTYPTDMALKVEKGKNIVVISMESLEQGFLTSLFSGLTPNLTALADKYTYFDQLLVGPGSSWTIASLYTYMTGMPLFYGDHSTRPFHQAKTLLLTSLGEILKKAGYQTRYVMGNPKFADMGDLVRLFDIPLVSEKTYPDRYIKAPFGLYDRDALDLAKSELELMLQNDQPFALFVSTVSTHAPDGFYDKSMESFVAKKSSDMAFTIASLDYNLGNFIRFLDDKGLLENTVFYLFPDHTMMGNGNKIIATLMKQPRKLYVITNASEQEVGKKQHQTLYQIDLPRFILNGAGVKNNAVFLTDTLKPDSNKIEFINKNKQKIATLNVAALEKQ